MVTVVMMMSAAADRLSQVRNVRELTALGRIGEIRGELVEFGRRGSISILCRGLRGILQIGGDLLGHLLILGRVRLLHLLQRAQQLREGRKLPGVGLLGRSPADAARRGIGRETGALKGGAENRLQIIVGEVKDRIGTHAKLIGTLSTAFE